MSFLRRKTPELGAGLAWNVMNLMLTQVKRQRGLTSFIERRGGINGKWLKPDKPYDIPISKLVRMLESKAIFQTDEEFLDDWNALGEYIINQLNAPRHLIHFL